MSVGSSSPSSSQNPHPLYPFYRLEGSGDNLHFELIAEDDTQYSPLQALQDIEVNLEVLKTNKKTFEVVNSIFQSVDIRANSFGALAKKISREECDKIFAIFFSIKKLFLSVPSNINYILSIIGFSSQNLETISKLFDGLSYFECQEIIPLNWQEHTLNGKDTALRTFVNVITQQPVSRNIFHIKMFSFL